MTSTKEQREELRDLANLTPDNVSTFGVRRLQILGTALLADAERLAECEQELAKLKSLLKRIDDWNSESGIWQ